MSEVHSAKVIMGDERKITDCDHFLQGTCHYGNDCFYRHPKKLYEPAIVCKFWQTYSCTNYYCPFLHPAVLPHTPKYTPPHYKPAPQLHPVSESNGKSSVVCAYYMSGRCSKPDCPYLHSLPDATSSRHPQCKSSLIHSFFLSLHYFFLLLIIIAILLLMIQ